jgi:nucleoside-diphosphate-sugar epimerase
MVKDEMPSETVLVTGVAGFIPSNIAERLLSNGYKVIGVDDLSIGKLENMASFIDNPNMKFVRGDIRDKELMAPIIKEPTYVIHGAVRGAAGSTNDPFTDLDVNSKGTLALLSLCLNTNIKMFIHMSSASVYGNPTKVPESEGDPLAPLSPYGVSKLAAEKYCMVYYKMYGVPVVCLRYFNNYGPKQNRDSIYGGVVAIFINQVLNDESLTIYGDGLQTRDFTYVGDTVNVTCSCLKRGDIIGEVFNIASGVEVSINDLARKIVEISGKSKVRIEHIKERPIDNVRRRLGDIRKAREVLNYNPSVSLEDGLVKTYRWYEAQRVTGA